MLDTGSSNLWVYSARCNASACVRRRQYDAARSRAHRRLGAAADGERFFIRYGSGGVAGRLGVDALRVGALSLPEQAFGEVETVDGAAFAHGSYDGIVGLGDDVPRLQTLLAARAAYLKESGVAESFVPEDVVRYVAEHASHELSPVCAIVGAITGAELIKLISGKDPPMNNVFLFDGHKSEGVVHRLGPSFDVDGAVDKGEATCLGVA